MAGYGQPFVAEFPTVGASTDTWGTELNTGALLEIKDTLEAPVTPSGMEIDDDIDMNGSALLTASALGLDEQDAVLSGATNLNKLYSVDGELYFNDGANHQVKLTDGGSLNAASLGGFTGDYGGVNPAEARFTEASSLYDFLESTGVHADVAVGELLLHEQLTDGADPITLRVPNGGPTVAYDFTLPADLPAGETPLTIDETGQVRAQDDIEVATVTASGTITCTTLVATAVNGTNVTTAGSGPLHGSQTMIVSPLQAVVQGGAAPETAGFDTAGSVPIAIKPNGTAHSKAMWPINLPTGERITLIEMICDDAAGGVGVGDIEMRVWKVLPALSDTSSAATEVHSAGDDTNQTIPTAALTLTITAGAFYYVVTEFNAASDSYVFCIRVTYDRVA